MGNLLARPNSRNGREGDGPFRKPSRFHAAETRSGRPWRARTCELRQRDGAATLYAGMYVFEIIIALLLAGAGLTALSRRIGTPYPAMVALAGAGLALVPGTPTLVLDPELALTLFVAPVLLDAAFDSSPRDLRANWRTVAGLAVGAVALTVVVVAVVARLLVPGYALGRRGRARRDRRTA